MAGLDRTKDRRPRTIAGIKTASKRSKHSPFFFSPQTMHFFDTYLPSQTWLGKGGSTIFITADRGIHQENHHYTVRRSEYSGGISDVSAFQAFDKLGEAKDFAAAQSEAEREKW